VWKVPRYQRKIVESCKKKNKQVIIATEMLESMISRPIPTRAEVNDIYTAAEMGADFVMLSGETSVGQYPVECVEMMKKVIMSSEGELEA
jgi:pyruvate kinase